MNAYVAAAILFAVTFASTGALAAARRDAHLERWSVWPAAVLGICLSLAFIVGMEVDQ